MIFYDPELDPSAATDAPRTRTARRTSAEPSVPRPHRPPSVRSLSRFLKEAQAAIGLRGQVTVLLTTDAAIRSLNRRFRGKNKATDVLSFPAEASAPTPELIAGDLAISVPTALRQAMEQGHPLATEVKVLMLHGLLHLAGYDHETDIGQMARRERLLRGRLGLPQGLIERTTDPAPKRGTAKRSSTASGSPLPAPASGRKGGKAQTSANDPGCPILSASSGGKGGKAQASPAPSISSKKRTAGRRP